MKGMAARVLVADDHPINRRVLERQFERLGYAADGAEDGARALELWRTGGYGLVIADCSMPVMDGRELARRIRAIEATRGSPRVPILACTGSTQAEEIQECLAAGMDGHLTKPVLLETLRTQVNHWLPPAGSSPQDVVLDVAVLTGASGGEPALEGEILRHFRKLNDADVAFLHEALNRRDAAALVLTAQRMADGGRSLGAAALAHACEELGHAGHAADWPAIEDRVRRLRQEALRLNAWIAERYPNGG